MTDLRTLADEVIEEGLLDKIKGIAGIAGKAKEMAMGKPQGDHGLLPREEWEEAIKDNRRAVELLANTPKISDALQVAVDLLDGLKETNATRKVKQLIRTSLRTIKDKKQPEDARKEAAASLQKVVGALQKEADAIRSVKQDVLHGQQEEIQKIAQIIPEDVQHTWLDLQ